MNLVLVGYRGTGKSEVGRVLGKELGMQVVSTDEAIVRKADKRIPEIVEERGWAGFRDLEEEVIREMTAADSQIIDCGGGVVERQANIAVLRAAGAVVWLKASPETIVKRIQHDTQRPSLTGDKSFTEEVTEVLTRRTPLYRRLAHIEVATDQLDIEEVAAEISRQVRSLGCDEV